MANLLDLMTPKEREEAEKRFKARRVRQKNDHGKISYEVYLLAKLGYYYGWQAIIDARNNKITFNEMMALVEGADKVWYSKLNETARAVQVANASVQAGKGQGNKIFREGLKPFSEKAKIEL